MVFLLVFFSLTVNANILSQHINPTLENGFDKTGIVIIGAGVVATLLAQTKDYEIRNSFNDYQKISNSTSRIGDFFGTGIPGATIALSQLFWDKDKGWAHSEALIDTFIITSILKYSNQRSRPASDNHHSMPSGHTSTTFATATSLAYSYGWIAAVPGYLAAVFTAATRWSDDAHWFSDTVAGAFVGYFWGRATWFHHSNIQLLPVVSSTDIGCVLRVSF